MKRTVTSNLSLVIVFIGCIQIAFAQESMRPGLRPRNDLIELYMFPGWFKPRSDLKSLKHQTRVVLKIQDDGTAILNPKDQGSAYLQVIDLNGLSLANACMLWGKGRKTPDGLTFDLFSDFNGPEQDVYHLDTKFKNGILVAYRVRGIRITKPNWCNVE